jgi:protein AIR1/2
MASASLVQVIDLTDSPPHVDNTRKIRKSPDHDVKATPTRTSRKRRNGETSKARTLAESRDSSAEEENAKPEEIVEIPRAEGSKGENGESTKKRNRRSKKSKDKGKDPVSSSLEDTQQDLPPTLEHDQLFFVDTTPADIPAGMVFDSRGADAPQSPSSSRAPEPDKTPALLLPAHVSVLGAVDGEPIQIVQPVDSDSDAESYIEYLDYDDRLVRLSHP